MNGWGGFWVGLSIIVAAWLMFGAIENAAEIIAGAIA